MSSSVRLTSANLHDSVLPFVRSVPVTLRTTDTVAEAHDAVRAARSAREVLYFYVLDGHDRLAGVVPVRHLLTAPLDERVERMMIPGVVAIPSWATVLVASEYFATRKLKAFPVIHDDGTLAGVVDKGLFTDEVIGVARETYDDIYQLLGVHATAMGTPWSSYLDRFPWLLSNMTGGLLCAFIAAQFEGLLQHAAVLALFIPIVLALAESVSMQSATLTLQRLSNESLKPARIVAALWREARTALLLGLSSGLLVGARAIRLAPPSHRCPRDWWRHRRVNRDGVPVWRPAADARPRLQDRSAHCRRPARARHHRRRHADLLPRARRRAAGGLSPDELPLLRTSRTLAPGLRLSMSITRRVPVRAHQQ